MIIFNTWRTFEIIINDQVNDDIDNKGIDSFKYSYTSLAGQSITLTLGTVTSILYQYHCKNMKR